MHIIYKNELLFSKLCVEMYKIYNKIKNNNYITIDNDYEIVSLIEFIKQIDSLTIDRLILFNCCFKYIEMPDDIFCVFIRIMSGILW